MRKGYLTTFLAVVSVSLSYLLTFHVIAQRFDVSGFGEYALSRRTLSVLAPVAILGADFAVARFVAYAAAEQSGEAASYLPAALIVMACGVGGLSLLIVIDRTAFSQFFFGSPKYVSVVVALPVLMVGIGLHQIMYNYLRGLTRYSTANIMMVINHGLVPLAATYFLSISVSWILVAIGGAWALVSVVFLTTVPYSIKGLRPRIGEILRYGVPRAPGDILQLGLFAAPSLMVAHLADVKSAGLVAFGTAALGMVGSLLTPISFVLLPAAAGMLATNRIAELKREIRIIVGVVTALVLTGTFLLEIVADFAIRSYLGHNFTGGIAAFRVIILAAPAYAGYTILKSVVDAHHIRAINTRNMLVSVAIYAASALALSLLTSSVTMLLIPFVVSINVLCGLTAWETIKTLRTVSAGATRGAGVPQHATTIPRDGAA